MADLLKSTIAEAPDRLATLVEERRALERQVSELQKRLATGQTDSASETINGITFIPRDLGDVAPRELKNVAEAITKQIGSGVVTLISTAEGKGSVVVAVTKDLNDRFSAVDLVRLASAEMGGKGGGGRPDMAQAGGPQANSDAVFAAIRQIISA